MISSGKLFNNLTVGGKKLFLCTSTLQNGVRYFMLCPLQGRIQDFLRGGTEHRGVSLKQGVWGAQPPRSYSRGFCYYNTKIMLIVRYRAYLSKYKEIFNQIWSRVCGGCNPLEDIGCFII